MMGSCREVWTERTREQEGSGAWFCQMACMTREGQFNMLNRHKLSSLAKGTIRRGCLERLSPGLRLSTGRVSRFCSARRDVDPREREKEAASSDPAPAKLDKWYNALPCRRRMSQQIYPHAWTVASRNILDPDCKTIGDWLRFIRTSFLSYSASFYPGGQVCPQPLL